VLHELSKRVGSRRDDARWGVAAILLKRADKGGATEVCSRSLETTDERWARLTLQSGGES
jgi:hypothetical protein